jgi:hypothetical protein
MQKVTYIQHSRLQTTMIFNAAFFLIISRDSGVHSLFIFLLAGKVFERILGVQIFAVRAVDELFVRN